LAASGTHAERHIVDGDQRAEFFDEIADLQHTLAPQEVARLPIPTGRGTATEPRKPQRPKTDGVTGRQ
jgi:hypothetical protein